MNPTGCPRPGKFILWLRVYLPGAAILDGTYTVPPVVEIKRDAYDVRTSAHIRLFVVAVWFLVIYFWPRMFLSVYKRAILVKGFGDGPIPINTLYTQPQALFADPLHPPASASKLVTTGVNRDTLITVGWLDLGRDRKSCMCRTWPAATTACSSPIRRTTPILPMSANARQVPRPATISSPAPAGKDRARGNEADFFAEQFGTRHRPHPRRIDSDLPTAYELAKQIHLAPLIV